MKSTLNIALFILMASGVASACEPTDLRDFGAFYGELGHSAKASGRSITISTSFLDSLSKEPTGAELEKNRNELFYLLATNNEQAVKAGLVTLVHLLKHPSFAVECDAEGRRLG